VEQLSSGFSDNAPFFNQYPDNSLWFDLWGPCFFITGGLRFCATPHVWKKDFFMLVLCLMMMPGVLTLTPSFILANQLHLRNTYSGLMLFYIGGAQAFSIFLLRTFFENQPVELFESARIDGANEMQGLLYIALPLSHSIIITIGIMNLLSYYNDLIFPMLMLVTEAKQTLMIMLQKFNPASNETGRPEVSLQVASYIVATIPQFLIFIVGMKYYIQGITSGAIKG
jgi:ABC-type glycerol-3-phosphate transport system permease component